MIAPEVGGGFGSKLQIYGEEIGCAWASRKLGRPVKWIETRSEDMMVTHHGRDQIDYVKVGAKRDGTLTAFHAKIIADFGAYQMLLTPLIPSLGAFVMGGCLQDPRPSRPTSPACSRTSSRPTRSAAPGRPEATHMIEVDDGPARRRAGHGPARAAAQELHPAGGFPADEIAIGVVYDSGNYDGALDKLLEHVDLDGVPAPSRRGAARAGHLPRHRVLAPTRRSAASRRRGPSARAASACRPAAGSRRSVRVHATGAVTRLHRHLAARPGPRDGVRADRGRPARRRPASRSRSSTATRGTGPYGLDTYGSRSLAVGGEAVARAADKVADKAQAIVAAPARGRARRTSSCATASSRCAARRTRA